MTDQIELREVARGDEARLYATVNALVNVARGDKSAQVTLFGFDGNRRQTVGSGGVAAGAVTSSGQYALDVHSAHASGLLLAARLHGTARTAAPTVSNCALLLADAGLFMGALLPIRLYGGATNYASLTPDANGGLALGGVGANAGQLSGVTTISGLASLNLSSFLSIGATPATTSAIRLPSGSAISYRNAANSANVTMIASAASNNVEVGDITNAPTALVQAATDVRLKVGTTERAVLNATDLTLTDNLAWKSGTSFKITLDHAASADRTVTVQDLAGTVALLGADNAGHLAFADGTYDIGGASSGRPRMLYITQNATIGGTMTLNGEASAKVVQTAKGSAALTLTGSFQDISSCSVTLTPGEWVVTGVFDMQVVGTDTAVQLQGALAQCWRVQVTATTTATVQAAKTGGTGTSVAGVQSTITAAFVGKP
jgi:hypothetical protein